MLGGGGDDGGGEDGGGEDGVGEDGGGEDGGGDDDGRGLLPEKKAKWIEYRQIQVWNSVYFKRKKMKTNNSTYLKIKS